MQLQRIFCLILITIIRVYSARDMERCRFTLKYWTEGKAFGKITIRSYCLLFCVTTNPVEYFIY